MLGVFQGSQGLVLDQRRADFRLDGRELLDAFPCKRICLEDDINAADAAVEFGRCAEIVSSPLALGERMVQPLFLRCILARTVLESQRRFEVADVGDPEFVDPVGQMSDQFIECRRAFIRREKARAGFGIRLILANQDRQRSGITRGEVRLHGFGAFDALFRLRQFAEQAVAEKIVTVNPQDRERRHQQNTGCENRSGTLHQQHADSFPLDLYPASWNKAIDESRSHW
jgi:hypothetical protein